MITISKFDRESFIKQSILIASWDWVIHLEKGQHLGQLLVEAMHPSK